MSKKFYYRRGEVETSEPWLVPTIENFDAWLMEWKDSVDLTDFSVYLGGSFARPYWQSKNEGVEKPYIETWDVDIIIIGPEDYLSLRKILNEASRIGFKHHLLIDASWDDMLYDNPDYQKSPSQRKKIRTNCSNCCRATTTLMLLSCHRINNIMNDGWRALLNML